MRLKIKEFVAERVEPTVIEPDKCLHMISFSRDVSKTYVKAYHFYRFIQYRTFINNVLNRRDFRNLLIFFPYVYIYYCIFKF